MAVAQVLACLLLVVVTVQMAAAAATTRCHNATAEEACDPLAELGRSVAGSVEGAWRRARPANASAPQLSAAAVQQQLRALQALLNRTRALSEDIPQTIVSLDTR